MKLTDNQSAKLAPIKAAVNKLFAYGNGQEISVENRSKTNEFSIAMICKSWGGWESDWVDNGVFEEEIFKLTPFYKKKLEEEIEKISKINSVFYVHYFAEDLYLYVYISKMKKVKNK